MILFPNCKINLGLRVLRKRQDGYHDLETVFYPLPFYDVLEMIPANGKPSSFTNTGLKIEGNQEDNLCLKAFELLKKDFADLPPVRVHLHKTIPFGAGLGGGSADGAFSLQLLNRKFNLDLSQKRLIDYALQLGSDCPFFIINKPCYATSRGEELAPVEVTLSSYSIVLVNPGIQVSTAKTFNGITPGVPSKSIEAIIQQPISTWQHELINDFESPVFTAYPSIGDIKKELYNKGALYASLSGTGSTVYGIFKKEAVPLFSFSRNYFIKQLALS